uniref:Uncharacterized protein n=1 Tax=Arundo donax TaxID=35708 RepID=A0A0A9GMN4_ARUDO
MAMGQRARRVQSSPCFEASQIPVAAMGMVQRRTRKLRHAVMLLLTAMAGAGTGRIGRIEDDAAAAEAGREC